MPSARYKETVELRSIEPANPVGRGTPRRVMNSLGDVVEIGQTIRRSPRVFRCPGDTLINTSKCPSTLAPY